jgi:hypothetical protein
VRRLHKEIHRIQTELLDIFPEKKEDVSASTDNSEKDAVRSPESDLAGNTVSPRRMGSKLTPGAKSMTSPSSRKKGKQTSNKEQALGRDIDKLFREKVQVCGPVKPNSTSPLLGVLKLVFKCLSESTRLEVLTLAMFHQLQLDVFALRNELPRALSQDDARVANTMLDEVITSAVDRCKQQQAALLDDLTLERYYKVSQHYLTMDKKA